MSCGTLWPFQWPFLQAWRKKKKRKSRRDSASQSYIFCICPAALRGPHFALSHQPQGQVGERRQVSTRSHCPFLWDEGEAGSCRGKVCQSVSFISIHKVDWKLIRTQRGQFHRVKLLQNVPQKKFVTHFSRHKHTQTLLVLQKYKNNASIHYKDFQLKNVRVFWSLKAVTQFNQSRFNTFTQYINVKHALEILMATKNPLSKSISVKDI